MTRLREHLTALAVVSVPLFWLPWLAAALGTAATR